MEELLLPHEKKARKLVDRYRHIVVDVNLLESTFDRFCSE